MMPEQEALFKKAEEALQAAEILLEKKFYTSAISRSYYAMFFMAEAALLQKGLAFSKHSGVIAAFGQHYAKTGLIDPSLHKELIKAQEDRLQADYEIDVVHNVDVATLNTQRARAMIHAVSEYLASV